MDIDVKHLPPAAAEAIESQREDVQIVRDGRTLAHVVLASRPVFRSHQELRDRIGALSTTVAELLREDRDGG